jgi:hypothetical protein
MPMGQQVVAKPPEAIGKPKYSPMPGGQAIFTQIDCSSFEPAGHADMLPAAGVGCVCGGGCLCARAASKADRPQ